MVQIISILVLLLVGSGCSASPSQTTPQRESFANKLGKSFLDLALPSEFNELVGLPKENRSSGVSVGIGQRQPHSQVVQDEDFPLLQNGAQGQTVYDEDECIGPVIMGRCHGSILPKGGYRKKCYGEWLGGQCTGPMF